MPMKNPPHPGDLIKTEVIDALGLNVSKAAEILKVRRATLSDLLNGKAALTPEMALRIEKAFGPGMDHLLRMQLAFDVAKTREHARALAIQALRPGLKRSGLCTCLQNTQRRTGRRPLKLLKIGAQPLTSSKTVSRGDGWMRRIRSWTNPIPGSRFSRSIVSSLNHCGGS